MTNFIRGFFGSSGAKKGHADNDFSAFFSRSSADKVKVVRQVLREANAEQRKVMEQGKRK
ncbi:MAG: hypothetical protein WDN10_01450 [bacterium]